MTAREREARAILMRRQGLHYDEIGEALGITKSGAFRLIQRWFDRHEAMVSEQADRLRLQEADRLDAMQAKLWPLAMGGQIVQVQVTKIEDGTAVTRTEERALPPDGDAVETILKIMARRARLLNLDLSPKVPVLPAPIPGPTMPMIGSAQNVLIASDAAQLREQLQKAEIERVPSRREFRTRDLSEDELRPETPS